MLLSGQVAEEIIIIIEYMGFNKFITPNAGLFITFFCCYNSYKKPKRKKRYNKTHMPHIRGEHPQIKFLYVVTVYVVTVMSVFQKSSINHPRIRLKFVINHYALVHYSLVQVTYQSY